MNNLEVLCPSRTWVIIAIIIGFILSIMVFLAVAPQILPYSLKHNKNFTQNDSDSKVSINASADIKTINGNNIIRDAVDKEIFQVESRMRDHFTLLITLSGLAITVILGGFSFSITKNEDRYIKEMKDGLRDGRIDLEKIRNACDKATDLTTQLEKRLSEHSFIKNTEQLVRENQQSPPQTNVSPAMKDLVGKVNDSQEAQAAFLAAGLEAYGEGDYSDARVFFSTYLKYNQSDVQVLFKLAHSIHCIANSEAVLSNKIRLLKDAEKMYLKVTELSADEYNSWNNLGIISELLGDMDENDGERVKLWEKAEGHYRKVLQIRPNDGDASNDLSMLFYKRAQHATKEEDINFFKNESAIALENAKKWGIKDQYNAACSCAIRGLEGECEKLLREAACCGCLPNREAIENERDLASMRDRTWFQDILDEAPEKLIPKNRQV